MELSDCMRNLVQLLQEEWKLPLLIILLYLLYIYYTKNYDFFEKKGVPYMKPSIIVGNLGPRLRMTRSTHERLLDVYDYFKGHQFGGVFEGQKPLLYVFDPDHIKDVAIRDFDHFVDRDIKWIKPKFMTLSLLTLQGQKWKDVRRTLTPTFSSSRIKGMIPLIEMCSKQSVENLKKFDKMDVEMKDAMGRFTLEVIGVCAFGMKYDPTSEEHAHFTRVAKKFNYVPKAKRTIQLLLFLLMPHIFPIPWVPVDIESLGELLRILKVVKNQRRISGIRKNDFLQLLLDASESEKNAGDEKYLDDETIDSQALLILIAGYETTSTMLSFAFHVLATKPELQEKMRTHIEEVTSGKEIDYDVLSQLSYLEGFLLEILRLYPPVHEVRRVCTRKYTFAGTKVHLNPGDIVVIPTYGIHMDPDIFPEPKECRPERFMGDEKKNRPSHLFSAFGIGPRNCIGYRFAIVSSKILVVNLLRNFKFSVCDKTEDPIKFHKAEKLLHSANGIWVRVEKL